MIKTCDTEHSNVISKLDMTIKRCPYDKTMTRDTMTAYDFAVALLEGKISNPRKGWEERRRKSLVKYRNDCLPGGAQAIKLEKDKRVFRDPQAYERHLANHELVLINIDELIENPPAWIGCSDGRIIAGELKIDVLRELEMCSNPYLLLNVADY